jgi:hypothetical protein
MAMLRAFVRPFIALLCGLLVAYLDVLNVILHFFPAYNNIIPILLMALLLPLALGVIVVLTADRQNEYFIALAMLAGVLAITGWYGYWYPSIASADDAAVAACRGANAPYSCHHGLISPDSHFGTTLLTYGWITSIILVLVSSSITGWLVKHVHKLSPLKE